MVAVSKRDRQQQPGGTTGAPTSGRTGRGSIERLQQRVREARSNVDAAMGAAADAVAVAHQLDQAAADWHHEADRVERELAVTQRLTGEPRAQAMKILRGRVDDLVAVANRFVETAFTEGLVPRSPELDRLHHARERLDALDAAHQELEELRLGAAVRVRSVRVMRMTRLWSHLPGVPRR